MKTTTALFFELMYDFQSERWNEIRYEVVQSEKVEKRNNAKTVN